MLIIFLIFMFSKNTISSRNSIFAIHKPLVIRCDFFFICCTISYFTIRHRLVLNTYIILMNLVFDDLKVKRTDKKGFKK
ncbi:hypothetical protein BGP_5668 [Beggiatoa sp. PS]|nr:hypothetical protein BGP_5668 [Beggiatoa sp. PS]